MAFVQNLKPGEDTGEWFDRELRPVIVAALGEVRTQAEADRQGAFAAVRHWLGELPQRSGAWSAETRQVVAALADELRGRIGG